jgi:putative membrane protein
MKSRNYKIFLLIVFVLVWVWAAWDPTYRHDWLLENYLVFIFVPILLITGRWFKLSNISYTLITVYMILHVIGSHYTYSEVPFGYTLQEWLGASRNMYDRLVHFSYGFLLAYPVREVFMRLAHAKGIWGYFFPVDITFALSAVYEIIEWRTAANVDLSAGLAFLGSQGDIWDAQKDMLMAGIGAILAMLIVFIVNASFQKGFWRDLWESLKPRRADGPLGEKKLAEYLKGR